MMLSLFMRQQRTVRIFSLIFATIGRGFVQPNVAGARAGWFLIRGYEC
jgi:hypothetical protein